jgi:hypothetical protein
VDSSSSSSDDERQPSQKRSGTAPVARKAYLAAETKDHSTFGSNSNGPEGACQFDVEKIDAQDGTRQSCCIAGSVSNMFKPKKITRIKAFAEETNDFILQQKVQNNLVIPSLKTICFHSFAGLKCCMVF